MAAVVGLAVLAYLIGSVPCGYLLVRWRRGLDVRQHGSHNVGAINVLRVGGPRLGLLTLLCDAAKAWAVVVLAWHLLASPWDVVACALAVAVGHAYSVWFLLAEGHFAEGKSVATTLGVLLGLAQISQLPWMAVLVVLGVWITGLVGPRLVTGRWQPLSLATISATLTMPVTVWAASADRPWVALGAALAALVLWRHRPNLARLLSATESSAADAIRHGPAG
jgi:glycerol-3-phosphate acyltransferase PlsY